MSADGEDDPESDPTKAPRPTKTAGGGARSRSRLGAVQALYQMELTGAPVERVVPEFIAYRLGLDVDDGQLVPADMELFSDLVQGVVGRQLEVDRTIARSLARGWTLARLDSILRALLRAGTYELLARPDVPAPVVLNEYVELAHAFFDGSEPRFVNGVLDRIARDLRRGTTPSHAGR